MSQDNGNATVVAEPVDVVPPQAITETAGEASDRTPWARWEVVAFLLLVLTALVMRLWDLGSQALHHDESLHATYSWYLYQGRGYIHNPLMHGPFQFFGTAGIFWLLWDSDATVRVLPALFGTALVAVPMLLRRQLGRSGALVTSVLLAFSPTMLYFSRFARNDIFMAVWAVLLVAFVWRYMDTRKARYLVLTAAVLALSFSTKETTYILVMILGGYLLVRAAKDVFPWIVGRKRLRDFSPAGELLVLMATLSLPLGSAGIALFQGPLGLTLANTDPATAPSGIPIGSGLYVAFGTVTFLVIVAAAVGLRWRPKVWLLSFGVFVTIWAVLHSAFFTSLGGLGSGIWQSLGYWIVQQDVARGGQPWYYYFVLGTNYEFLAVVFGAVAVGVLTIRGSAFSRFLVYWAVANLLFFIYASEKMPWLLVGVSLPFIILTGKLLGEMIDKRPWLTVEPAREDDPDPPAEEGPILEAPAAVAGPAPARLHWPALALPLAVAVMVVAGGWILLSTLPEETGPGTTTLLLVGLAFVIVAAGVGYLLSRVDGTKRGAAAGVSVAVVMLALTLPFTFRAAYANSDVPVEMLVYTQTAPDIPDVMGNIRRLGDETGKGMDIKITVDSTDGYSWPWAWYLRDYANAGYPCLGPDTGCERLSSSPDADVVLLSTRSDPSVLNRDLSFGEPVRYKHRWWFPESYRGLDPTSLGQGIKSREAWCGVVNYFWDREFQQGIGSVDGYAYFPADFTPSSIGLVTDHQESGC